MCTDYGLCGCCTPTLYCNTSHCYTSSLSSKNNYYVNTLQGLSDTLLPSFSPVFICSSSSSNIPIPTITSLVYESNSIVTIEGISHTYSLTNLLTYLLTTKQGSSMTDTTNNDYQDDNIGVYIDNQQCNSVEICSTCLSCDMTHSCPLGSLCLAYAEYMGKYEYACFNLCAGPTDTTCPCGNYCHDIGIYYGYDNKMDVLSLCSPTFDLSVDGLCPEDYEPSIQCNSFLLTYSYTYSLTYSLASR